MTSEAFNRKIEDLRRRFRERLPSEIATADGLYQDYLKAGDGSVELRELQVVAHRMAGSGATFGYPEISDAASALEQKLTERLDAGREDRDDDDELTALLAILGNSVRAVVESP